MMTPANSPLHSRHKQTLEPDDFAQIRKQLQVFGPGASMHGESQTRNTAEEVQEEILYVESSTEAALVSETESLLVLGEAVPKPPEYQEEEVFLSLVQFGFYPVHPPFFP